jgi:hypothetical protein
MSDKERQLTNEPITITTHPAQSCSDKLRAMAIVALHRTMASRPPPVLRLNRAALGRIQYPRCKSKYTATMTRIQISDINRAEPTK